MRNDTLIAPQQNERRQGLVNQLSSKHNVNNLNGSLMLNYDFSTMPAYEFERLVRDLLQEHLGGKQ